MSGMSKGRALLFTSVGVIMMMALAAMAQYLVSGNVSTGVMVAIGVPTGMLFGTSLARTGGRRCD
jgi:hypothetical protein